MLCQSRSSICSAANVHKSYVCKYVGTPYVDERLQTGDNPIFVDNHSLLGHDGTTYVGQEFSDKHGKSVVIVANTEKLDPEPGLGDCPPAHGPKQIPLPNPNFIDLCGPDNAEWEVPVDTDEIVWTLKPGGQLVAETTQGYEFTDGTTKHNFGKAPDSGKACPVLKQPPAPVVKKDKCGVTHDTYRIPSASGVTYYVNGVEVAAGVHSTNGELIVTVSAVAEDGSGYTKDNSWSLQFTDVPCEEEGPMPVQYPKPTVEVVCGPNNDIVTVPLSGNHITYTSKGWKNGKFVVTAVTDKGYYFQGTDGKTKLVWKFHDHNTECGGGQGEGQPVTPAEPTVTPVCGPNNDTVTLPDTAHVTYSQTGWVDGKNTVTATVDEGYYISGTEGETTMEWTFTDENTPCGGQVLGETTKTPNVPAVAAVQLENTGNSIVLPMLLSTGILSLAIMTMLEKGGKRSSKLAAFVQRAADRLYESFAQPFVLPTV